MTQPCVHCGQMHPAYAQVCPLTGLRVSTASFTLVNDDVLLVGTVVGRRWHVKEALGSGSSGSVYAAEHIDFGRTAALKVLRPRYATPDTVHHVFHGEARAVWMASHPCLVEVLDCGELPDGAPFFVMERLEGETLAQRVERERLSTGAAVDVVMQILSAMDSLHARQILVRDLHPQNVFLATRRGCRPLVKLLDVGLSRLVPLEALRADWDALQRTTAREAAGARSIPYYLSPERARSGDSVEIASDLFVAMLLFYEALTAERPFESTSFDGIVDAIANARPPRISERRPDVPPELDGLVMRALSSQPHMRPASARDLQDELRAVFDGSARRASTSLRAAPVVAVPPPPATVSAASAVDSNAHTPREVHAPSQPPETFASASLSLDALYEEETRTDNSIEEITNAGPRPHLGGDESSADAPHRTERPPSAYDIQVDEAPPEPEEPAHDEPHTSPGEDFEAAMRALREDEETETMELTAELRARIEAMARAKAAPPPASKAESSKPPPTRRVR